MTKSALSLARESLRTAEAAMPSYSHRFSPKRYTQPQLTAILVVRHFYHLDYRGTEQMLREWSDLRDAIGLKRVPTYSTLCRAEERLFKKVPLPLCSLPFSTAVEHTN
jgi:hypothetical protein